MNQMVSSEAPFLLIPKTSKNRMYCISMNSTNICLGVADAARFALVPDLEISHSDMGMFETLMGPWTPNPTLPSRMAESHHEHLGRLSACKVCHLNAPATNWRQNRALCATHLILSCGSTFKDHARSHLMPLMPLDS